MANPERECLTVMDTETVPDEEIMPEGHDPEAFPPLAMHRLVSLSMVEAEIVKSDTGREFYRVKGIHGTPCPKEVEGKLVKRYWDFMGRRKPRLVTWNGRGFDIPLLKLRAMVHGVSAASWSAAGDKWDNYGKRYSQAWHCDLQDVLCDFGAVRGIKQNDVARAMGLPGKMGMHGSQVGDLVKRGRSDLVSNYCDHDVITLYSMYVRHSFANGFIDASAHNASIASMMDFLEDNRVERPHFGEYLDAWNASVRPMPRAVPVPPFVPELISQPAEASTPHVRRRGSMTLPPRPPIGPNPGSATEPAI